MAARPVVPIPIDLTVADSAWTADLSNFDIVRLQPVVVAGGTWGIAEITVETTIAGDKDSPIVQWKPLGTVNEGPPAPLVLGDENEMLGPYFLQAIKPIRFRVTTTQPGACEVLVYVIGGTTVPEALVLRIPS